VTLDYEIVDVDTTITNHRTASRDTSIRPFVTVPCTPPSIPTETPPSTGKVRSWPSSRPVTTSRWRSGLERSER
jgi:hypothetical protein